VHLGGDLHGELGGDPLEQGPVLGLHPAVHVDDPPLPLLVGSVVAGDPLTEQGVGVIDRGAGLVQHVEQAVVGVLQHAAEHQRIGQLGSGDAGGEVGGDPGVALLGVADLGHVAGGEAHVEPVPLDLEVLQAGGGGRADAVAVDEGQMRGVERVVHDAWSRCGPCLHQLVDHGEPGVLRLGQVRDVGPGGADADPDEAVAFAEQDGAQAGPGRDGQVGFVGRDLDAASGAVEPPPVVRAGQAAVGHPPLGQAGCPVGALVPRGPGRLTGRRSPGHVVLAEDAEGKGGRANLRAVGDRVPELPQGGDLTDEHGLLLLPASALPASAPPGPRPGPKGPRPWIRSDASPGPRPR
jgi:hypothetical protein